MTNYDYPRLCGGTVFTLILEARKDQMDARDHFNCRKDGLTNPEVMQGLLKVMGIKTTIDKGKPWESFEHAVNKYRFCTVAKGAHLPLNHSDEIEGFDRKIRNDYSTILKEMESFIGRFLEINTSAEKDKKLIKALLDLVCQDKNIKDDDRFFVLENGLSTDKMNLLKLTNVCLPTFLIGIWHYALMIDGDNKVGEDTMKQWCPPMNGAPRVYKGRMGKNWTTEITFIMPTVIERSSLETFEDNRNNGEDLNETENTIDLDQEEYDIPHVDPAMNQFIAHPKANVHYGSGDIFSDIDTLTITKNYYGGKGE